MDNAEKPVALEASHAGRRFMIQEDKAAGFYIYAFESERCTHDYLQDNLETVKRFARERFGVPEDAWHELTSAA
jgi:hypothetical protein